MKYLKRSAGNIMAAMEERIPKDVIKVRLTEPTRERVALKGKLEEPKSPQFRHQSKQNPSQNPSHLSSDTSQNRTLVRTLVTSP